MTPLEEGLEATVQNALLQLTANSHVLDVLALETKDLSFIYRATDSVLREAGPSTDLHIDTLLGQCDRTTTKGKNASEARAALEKAELLYKEKRHVEALGEANKAVILAPFPKDAEEEDSDLLTSAFLRRSEVLFALKRYKASAGDLTQAFAFGTPGSTPDPVKLLATRVKALVRTNEFFPAFDCIQDFRSRCSSLLVSTEEMNDRLEALEANVDERLESVRVSNLELARDGDGTEDDVPDGLALADGPTVWSEHVSAAVKGCMETSGAEAGAATTTRLYDLVAVRDIRPGKAHSSLHLQYLACACLKKVLEPFRLHMLLKYDSVSLGGSVVQLPCPLLIAKKLKFMSSEIVTVMHYFL
jgi:hypothetical protein